jgi:hypothetical protein
VPRADDAGDSDFMGGVGTELCENDEIGRGVELKGVEVLSVSGVDVNGGGNVPPFESIFTLLLRGGSRIEAPPVETKKTWGMRDIAQEEVVRLAEVEIGWGG